MSIRSIVILFAAISLPLMAESGAVVSISDSINASGTITVNQPAKLSELLVRHATAEPEAGEASESTAAHRGTGTHVTRTGYRVQIFEDNNPRSARSQAERYHAEISNQFPHIRSYVTFNSPYWRVKAGDFRTRSEAEAAMAEFRQAFPGVASYMRVVRDRINTID